MRNRFVADILRAFPGSDHWLDVSSLIISGEECLPSWFEVSELASASIGCAGLMVSGLKPEVKRNVTVDQYLASSWFGMTLRPDGWSLPPIWDPIAGDPLKTALFVRSINKTVRL